MSWSPVSYVFRMSNPERVGIELLLCFSNRAVRERCSYAVHSHCFFCGEIDARFSARTGLRTDPERIGL